MADDQKSDTPIPRGIVKFVEGLQFLFFPERRFVYHVRKPKFDGKDPRIIYSNELYNQY